MNLKFFAAIVIAVPFATMSCEKEPLDDNASTNSNTSNDSLKIVVDDSDAVL